MFNKDGELTYKLLEDDFQHYISSLLIYRYTAKTSDLSSIGDQIFDRYFPDGKVDDPLEAVKVSINVYV